MRRDHIDVTDGTGLVLIQHQRHRQSRRLHGFILHLRFLFQNAQCSQIVFHFLERGQHGLLVRRHRSVIGSHGLRRQGTSGAAVKNDLPQLRSERPDAAGQVEPIGKIGRLITTGRCQRQRRIISRLGDADLSIGGGRQTFGRSHVRPPLQQHGWQGDRNRWRNGGHRRTGNREGGGRLPYQQRNRMLQLCALYTVVKRRGLRRLQLRLRLDHVGFGGHADGILILRELVRTLIGGHGIVEQLLLTIKYPQLQIVLGQLRLRTEAGCCQIGGAGLRTRFVRLDIAPHPAPDIDFPIGIERKGISVLDRTLASGRDGTGTGMRRTGGQRRRVRRTGALHQRQRLPEFGFILRQVLIGDIDLLDQGIELRVVEHFPPLAVLHQFARLRRFPVLHFLEGRRCRCHFRPHVIRSHRTCAQQ